MLKDFVDNIAQNSHLKVEKELGDGFFKLRASEAQRRQAKQDIRCVEDIIVEMLRNSKDAGAKNIYVATTTQGKARYITIIDDGDGVPIAHHKNIFEPYVTSKLNTMTEDKWGVHGRGMALYSIKLNANESRVLKSDKNIGCSIYVKTFSFPEKKDQSTFPNFTLTDDKTLAIRGPKNIIRTTCEFAIENRSVVKVYLGSPSEIAATMYKNRSKTVFNEPDSKTKVTDLLKFSSDAKEFCEYAKQIGIDISERTARRIMDGEVSSQKNILERISEAGIEGSKSAKIKDTKFKIKRKANVKLSKEDQAKLISAVQESFKEIGNKYYLNTEVQPKLSIRNGKINISFNMENQ